MTSIAYADQSIPAVTESQILSTVTSADIVGLTMETDAGIMSISYGGSPSGFGSQSCNYSRVDLGSNKL